MFKNCDDVGYWILEIEEFRVWVGVGIFKILSGNWGFGLGLGIFDF
jgi:hypothetical protein